MVQQQPVMGQGMPMQQPQMVQQMAPQQAPGPEQGAVGLRPVQVLAIQLCHCCRRGQPCTVFLPD